MAEKNCGNCRHMVLDERETVYRRGKMYFCRCSPFPMSRQYKPGEGSRVLPEMAGCPRWAAKEEAK